MDAASIRVNATTLPDFSGRIVRVIGKVQSFDSASDSARVDAGGSIDLSCHDQLQVGKIYEFIGKAGASEKKVNVYSSMEMSDNTDVTVANKLADYVKKVPELFY